jgi:hypothetical protein
VPTKFILDDLSDSFRATTRIIYFPAATVKPFAALHHDQAQERGACQWQGEEEKNFRSGLFDSKVLEGYTNYYADSQPYAPSS